MNSSVLIIGHQAPELGADHVADFAEAMTLVAVPSYRVVVLPVSRTMITAAMELMRARLKAVPTTRFVLSAGEDCPHELLEAMRVGSVYKITLGFDDPQFANTVRECMERASLAQQDEDLLKLIHGQTEQLKTAHLELEEHVHRRTKSLNKTRAKLVETNARVEVLHAALIAIHKAPSVAQMEVLLTETLRDKLGIANTRIVFESQSHVENLASSRAILYQVPLQLAGGRAAGLVFSKEAGARFSKNEELFLDQVAEAVGLAVDRRLALEALENVKKQWDATFDAISEPLCLTTDQHRILRTNRAFCEWAKKTPEEVVSQDPFALICGTPITELKAAQPSRFKFIHHLGDKTLEIAGANFLNQTPTRWILFRDVTEARRLETQLVESAKMAELGTIGSSIAHELNNPVGGMLSFLQLIKMDLKVTDPIFADIEAMEQATRRCKDIIENLLGFSRKHDTLGATTFDLRPLLQRILQLIQLQTGAHGIHVELKIQDEPLLVQGHPERLQQALMHIAQNASEAVLARGRQEPSLCGHITIEQQASAQKIWVSVTDNGLGIEAKNLKYVFNPLYSTKNPQTNAGLGLTLAFQTIREHDGELEIQSQAAIGTTAKISLQRPDLTGDGRLFDGKI